MNYFNHLFILVSLVSTHAFAVPRTINFQANIRKPDSSRLESPDVSYRFKYLNAAGTCTVYVEDFNNISMVGSAGNISLKMGTGAKVFPPASVTLYETFNNDTANTFDCSEGGTYAPLSSDERRNLIVEFFYPGSGGVQALNGIEINSVPYALHANEAEDAQKLGGYAAALYAKFSNFTTCTGGQVLTYNGTIFSCVSPGAAATFTGVLAGDVSGTQSATVVDTVGGKTSAQVSTSVDDTLNATSAATASRIVKRDGSGNAAFNTAQANNFSGRNLLLYEATNTNHIQVQAPATFAAGDYVLTLPDSKGLPGQVLSTDGNGVTTWIPASTGSVTNVTAGAPLLSSGGATPNITMPAATAAVDGYLSAADFTTFNSKVSSQWTNNGADIFFNTGRVGIGTNTPAAKLSVFDAAAANANGQELVRISGDMSAGVVGSGPKINFENSASNTSAASIRAYTFGVGATGLAFDTGYGAPATRMIIDNTGNVGVGNLSPTYKVDVVGDVNVTGNFKINGVNIASGTVTNVAATLPLTSTGGATPTIAMPTAATAQDGYLTSADWNTFNNKQTAGAYITALTGDVTAAGPGSAAATIANNAITTSKINNLAVTDAKINDVAFGKITGKPTTLAGYGITDAVTNVTAGAPLVSSGGTTPNITMPAATAAVDGYLSAADFTTFNNKVSSQWITSGSNIYYNSGRVGIGTGAAIIAPLTIATTDATTNTGGIPFPTSYGGAYLSNGVDSTLAIRTLGGGNAQITTDAPGRYLTFGTAEFQERMRIDAAGNVGIGTTSPSASLDVNGTATFGSTGKVNISSTGVISSSVIGNYTPIQINNPTGYAHMVVNGAVDFGSNGSDGYIKLHDNSKAISLNGSGIQFNYASGTEAMRISSAGRLGLGITNPAYKLDVVGDVNVTGNFKINGVNIASGTVSSVGATSPLTSTGGATPTIAMPAATTAVDGYLTAADWNTFNNKQPAGSYITALTGDVVAAGPGSSAATIQANAITTSKINNLAVTDAKINDVAFSKITGKPTTLGGYGITDALSSTLAPGNIYVGNGSSVATAVMLGGDVASISNTGSVTLASTVAAGTVGSASAVPTITYDAKGRITSTSSNAYQDATGVTKGIVQAGANISVTGGVISVPTANGVVAGVLSAGDYNTFNGKVSSQWSNNVLDIYFNTGKVGIGTNIPYAPLHVVATNQAGGSNNDGNLYIQTSDAQGINVGGSLGFGGLDGGGSDRVFATAAGRKENGTSGNYAGYFAIETRPNGGSLAEGLRVTSIGRVGIGLTNPSYKLDVNGDINIPAGSNFKINGTNVGLGTVTGTGTTNRISKFTAAGAIGDSNISDNGTVVAVSTDATVNGVKVGLGGGAISSNNAFGTSALNANTTGSWSLAVGYQALMVNTTGYSNTAVGAQNLQANTTGYSNTGTGSGALRNNTTGNNNTANGTGSLQNATTGSANTAIGSSVLVNNTTASDNTAVGSNALLTSTTGAMNSAIGRSAMAALTTGSRNTAIGYLSGQSITTGSSNVIIGGNDGSTIATSNNNIIISDGDGTIQQQFNASGLVGIGMAPSTYKLSVNGDINIPAGSNFKINGVNVGLGTVTGTGTTNTVPKFTAAGAIGNSNITDNGTVITLATDATVNGVKIGRGASSVASNTALGVSTLQSNTTGSYNVAVGQLALTANADGNYNVAVGVSAMNANTSGSSNAAFGANAMIFNTVGGNNTGIGSNALRANISGNDNMAVGGTALYGNTTGSSNVAAGYGALRGNTTGNFNVATGTYSLFTNTVGAGNVANGHQALYYTTGNYNTGMGHSALQANTTGINNSAFGYNSGNAITTGSYNVVIGSNTGSTIATSSNNIIISDGAGTIRQQIDSSGRVGIGMAPTTYMLSVNGDVSIPAGSNFKVNGVNAITGSGSANTIPKFTSAGVIGASNITDDGSTVSTATDASINGVAVGRGAGNIASNVVVGAAALLSNTTGIRNTAVGQNALLVNSTGFSNTALGNGTLTYNASGNGNTAVGQNILPANTTGSFNAALGWATMRDNTIGSNNTAMGNQALLANTTGGTNVALGYAALPFSKTGNNNIGIGASAMSNLDSGSNNIGIGPGTGWGVVTGSNNVIIGTTFNLGDVSNTIAIGQSNVLSIYVNSSNQVGLGGIIPTQALDVSGNIKTSGCLYYNSGSLGTCASDERLKEDVHAFDLGLETLLGINPVNFKYNGKAGLKFNGQEQIGVIAQDLEKTAPSLVKRQMVQMNPEDKEKTEIKVVDYGAFTYVMINSIKDLYSKWFADSTAIHRELASVKEENLELKKKNEEIQKRLDRIEQMLNSK